MVPIYIVAGCFVETLAVILINVPLFLPVITQLGFDPIWFGVQMVLLTQIGLVTPPVGMTVYTVRAVAPEVPLGVLFRGAVLFLPMITLCTIFPLYFPQIALWLPKSMW